MAPQRSRTGLVRLPGISLPPAVCKGVASLQVRPRSSELLLALDRCPLTASQLLKLSRTFDPPFTTERRVRERLEQLRRVDWVCSWPYATTSHVGSPNYWKLTRNGFRLFHGSDAPLPNRRYFEEIGIGHHHHAQSL